MTKNSTQRFRTPRSEFKSGCNVNEESTQRRELFILLEKTKPNEAGNPLTASLSQPNES